MSRSTRRRHRRAGVIVSSVSERDWVGFSRLQAAVRVTHSCPIPPILLLQPPPPVTLPSKTSSRFARIEFYSELSSVGLLSVRVLCPYYSFHFCFKWSPGVSHCIRYILLNSYGYMFYQAQQQDTGQCFLFSPSPIFLRSTQRRTRLVSK